MCLFVVCKKITLNVILLIIVIINLINRTSYNFNRQECNDDNICTYSYFAYYLGFSKLYKETENFFFPRYKFLFFSYFFRVIFTTVRKLRNDFHQLLVYFK